VQVCGCVREQTGLETVALSGGVFMNALLLCEIVPRLEQEGFHTYRHELVPPNDGGLSLGQLVIAAALQSGDNAAAAVASGFKA
jgi:hydrogenase maturation protein HypF